jgi:asparagine synthase (glutamine-hydrolysing)
MDHRLFEFCATLPPERKSHRGTSKVILRQIAREVVPRSILRRSKKGFNAPVSHWLAGSWTDVVQEYLNERKLRQTGVFNPAAVRTLWVEHQSGGKDHGYLLFAILQLALWLDKVRPALPERAATETRRRAA